MSRPGLSDEEFAALKPLLPEERPNKPGRPYHSHRLIVDAIFWIVRTGSPWRDLPAKYGPWGTVYDRFRRWQKDGTWKKIFQTLQSRQCFDGSFGALDSSVIRAHKAAAGAAKLSDGGERLSPTESREEQALGGSRGGLSTKIHILVEGQGKPVVIQLSPGQQHDTQQAISVLDELSIATSQGPPRTHFDAVAADKAYDSQAIRDDLQKRGSTPVIAHRRNRQGEYPDSAKDFDKQTYRQRNIVERTIGHLKEFRRIATRYEKLASRYLAMLYLGVIRLWLRRELADASAF